MVVLKSDVLQSSHAVDWLKGGRSAPGEPRFPGLATLGMIEAEVEANGKKTCSKRYYISSAKLSATQLNHGVRAHWGIENRLHWVMDVVFHDDLMRLRTQKWTRKHGSYQTHCNQHHQADTRQGKPKSSKKNSSLG